jgi:hypothetical protein
MTTFSSAKASLAARFKDLPSDGVDRETLLAGLNRFAALKALHPMLRDGEGFFTRGARGARRYFSSAADRDAWKACLVKVPPVEMGAIDVIRQRLQASGASGLSRAEVVEGLSNHAQHRAVAELMRSGELFRDRDGSVWRYFRLQAWCDAHEAARLARAVSLRAATQSAYGKRVMAAKPKPAPKPRQQVLRVSQKRQWTPPEAAPVRPVIIPEGLVPTVLRGFSGDRWGVQSAPSVITGAACRPWAAAAAGARG